MKKNIFFIAQSKSEIELFLNSDKFSDQISIIPIELEALIFCDSNNLRFLNPKELLSKNFHEKTILASEKYFSKKKNDFSSESINKEVNQYFRFRYNAISFINDIILNLKKKYRINTIILTGDNIFYNARDKRNRFLHSIIKSLYNEIKINKLRKTNIIRTIKVNSYLIEQKLKPNTILFTNLGYNFKRIIRNIIFKKNVAVISNNSNRVIYENQSKFNLIKTKILSYIGVQFIDLKKNSLVKSKIKIKRINAFIGKKNISKILNSEISQIEPYYNDIYEKYKCFKKFFGKFKPKFIISNVTVGFLGSVLDSAKKNKLKVINIPHGTLVPHYDKFDKIYKKIISEGVFYDKSDYCVCHSRITEEFLSARKFRGKRIEGNIILGSQKKKKINSKQILYAVTNKSFHNQQLIGVENFFEFYENLAFYNNDKFFKKFKFKVQLHPSIRHLKKELEKKFVNLIFDTKNLEKNISESFLIISFSSTVIEDALTSNLPVILFDKFKRYRHFKNKKLENSEILNYINKKNDLKKKINSIFFSAPNNFSSVNYSLSSKESMANLINVLEN